jgi:hypothetical protein
MKMRPVGAKMFHVERKTKTGMTELKVTFRNFANVPKYYSSLLEELIPQGLPLCSTAMQDGCSVSY